MASTGKPSAAKASGWQSCELCSKQPAGDSYDVFRDDDYEADYSHLEKPVDNRKQLLEMLRDLDLDRCPICHTYYLSSSESDPHHYMSYTQSIARISDEEALRELAAIKTKTAKQWLRQLRAKLRKS